MTTLTLRAHLSVAPQALAEDVTGIVIARALLALGMSWRKTA